MTFPCLLGMKYPDIFVEKEQVSSDSGTLLAILLATGMDILT